MKKLVLLILALALCLTAWTIIAQEREDPAPAAVFEWTGPWHLDGEKNDLAAFWALFPGYAEAGAGMEIRSSGLISWYIGEAGGSGVYTFEDGMLLAALMTGMGEEELRVEFRFLEDGDAPLLEMIREDMTVYWRYGDREDEPVL